MQVIAEKKASAFLAAAGPHLTRSPIENNLILGIASALEHGGEPLLLRVEKEGTIELVAIQTPPRHLVLCRGGDAATRRLADHLAAAREPLPGVLGPRETVERFADAWSERTHASARLARVQILYELRESHTSEVKRVVPGRLREARPDDEQLLAEWSLAFQEEVGVFVGIGGDPRPFVRAKVQAGQLLVWENDRVVSMAGWAARTPRAVRVNYVYTPPAERRKGYAEACVGALSKKLLDEGSEACLLFADAGNATSNGLYLRLGYCPLCEFAQYDFSE
jgi:predicted GNAT family acetyltransferase